jgi:hypothetical protein
MTLLFNSGLPTGGYHFLQHSLAEREVMVEQLFARADTVVTTVPAVTMVEIEVEQVVYLITQPGHFAHPSIMQRSLVRQGKSKAIRTTGFTAEGQEVMSTWLNQFRQQDEFLMPALTK